MNALLIGETKGNALDKEGKDCIQVNTQDDNAVLICLYYDLRKISDTAGR